MKLSLIIPYMEVDEGKPAILERCLNSFTGADEIIVVENWREGYAVPINYGLSQATGEFLMVSNDDLIYDGGSLKRICREDGVTSPTVNGVSQPFWGCCFCVPRWVYEKVGGLWEGYRISFWDDDDYYQILKHADIPIYGVPTMNVLNPEGGRTLSKFPDRNEFFEENHKLYLKRWGKEPEF